MYKTQRSGARRLVLAGLIAGSLLLLPALAESATQHTKRVLVPGPDAPTATTRPGAGAGARTRVSPYVRANRQRAAASRATHASAESLSVRQPHKPAGSGQRQ